MDSTHRGARFGVLPFSEIGKPAIHLGGSGPARRTIPMPPASETTSSLTTSALFDDDGAVSGQTVATGRGAFGIWLSETSRDDISENGSAGAAALLRRHGTPGSGTIAADPLADDHPDYTVHGTFRIPDQIFLLKGGYFSLWTGLRFLPRAGDFLAGPALGEEARASSEPTFCFPGSQREELSLILPPGRGISSLPRDMEITNDLISYRSHWTRDGRKVIVTRMFETRVQGPVCDGEIRKSLMAVLPRIRDDMTAPIGFEWHPLPPPPEKLEGAD